MKRVAVYTVRIMGPDDATDDEIGTALEEFDESDAFERLEDSANDCLPDGYYCKVDAA